MSWHQCHCDLYRPFLTDYPELGPHAALNGMSEPDRVLMRDKCLGHAEQIVRVLTDFIHHKQEQHLLEHDAAVCAYHAARLVLFGTYNASRESDFPMRMAMNKAQMCLDVIKRYFSFSAQLESMRKALEAAIDQHKTRWKPNGPVEGTPRDPDPDPPNISRDAHNRQRLAIHSLLRQSDFVDDSREAALESSTQAGPTATLPVAAESAATTNISQRVDWNVQDTIYPPWNFMPNDPNSLYGFPFGTGMLDFGGSMAQGTDELGNLIGSLDEHLDFSFTLDGHTDGLMSAAFSPDGTYIATAAWDGKSKVIQKWELDEAGQRNVEVADATWSESGRRIAYHCQPASEA
ncbi:uncharacterized protein N0V89_002958 [Didymosphaeria variabile]|uniref:WD40 repeat-like protein n=1 Tax=Didymosphaeria variabile TaxID=1932322 RepID=A0A9W8XTH3_9PLEO|nr:uncharacterized protein N0V89_002958 [Didymosphaeria variabile]KAJ4358376.1 hypothetical protein N0V89_002958 [Didymosphaeria variabile]